MKVLVMYDSIYGNTERVARLISEELREKGLEAECRHQSESGEEDFMGKDLWVLGSPTRWGRPTFRFKTLVLNGVKEAGKDHDFVTFDTRYENMHSGAADRLSRASNEKGAEDDPAARAFRHGRGRAAPGPGREGTAVRPDHRRPALISDGGGFYRDLVGLLLHLGVEQQDDGR